MRSDISESLRNMIFMDLEHIVFRLDLTFSEIFEKLELKGIDSYFQFFELPPVNYEIVVFKKSLPSYIVVTTNENRLRIIS